MPYTLSALFADVSMEGGGIKVSTEDGQALVVTTDYTFPPSRRLLERYAPVAVGDPVFISLRRIYLDDSEAWFNEADIAVLLRINSGEGTVIDKQWILAAYTPKVHDGSFVNLENLVVWCGPVPASLTIEVKVVSMLQDDKRKADQFLQVAGAVAGFIPTYGQAAKALVEAGREINSSLPDQAILLEYVLGCHLGEGLRYAPYCVIEQDSLSDYRDRLWFDSSENEVQVVSVNRPFSVFGSDTASEPVSNPDNVAPASTNDGPAATPATSDSTGRNSPPSAEPSRQDTTVTLDSRTLHSNWAVFEVRKGLSNTFAALQGERTEALLSEARALFGRSEPVSTQDFDSILKRANSATALSIVMARAQWNDLDSIRRTLQSQGTALKSLVPEDRARLLTTVRAFFPKETIPDELDDAGVTTLLNTLTVNEFEFDKAKQVYLRAP